MSEKLSIDDAIVKLNDSDIEIRKLAVSSLKEIDDEKLIEDKKLIDILIDRLNDESPLIKHEIAKILGNIGESAVDPLLNAIKNGDGEFKKFVSFALKETSSGKAIDYFIGCLDDEDWAIRKIAVRSLGELKVIKAVELISNKTGDEDWGVRLAAIRSLGDLEIEEAIAPIKKARRKEKDKDFKKAANKAIKQIEKVINKK
ncbi:MAG: HEAT repeat domain-containing protein [Methanobrevibacter sp.]|jgi:HEAT repeat protein|nr:HEAT repeat domain-containing protein [Methanobrevibacter sp.]